MADAITKGVQTIWQDAANRPWRLRKAPFRVAPHVYYVGNTWVGSYLVETADGLVLIDTTVFEGMYLVLESIWELGFDPRDIKHIFLSHCHADHCGGVNQFKELSGAKIWQSREDTDFMKRPANLELGNDFKVPDYTVDCFYEDGGTIEFGDISIKTILTPGHTPGTVSFFISVPEDDGNRLIVAMHGGVGPNTMTDEYYEKFGEDKSLRRRFIEGCDRLKAIHVDICVPSHPAHGDLFKRISQDPMDYRTLIDPSEWPRFCDIRKEFVQRLERK